MEPLAKLFGSRERLKIMRFFLLNPKTVIGTLDLAHNAGLNAKTAQKEVMLLVSAGFIKKKVFYRIETLKRAGKIIERREKVKGWVLDETFAHAGPLKQLLIESRAFQKEAIVDRFKHVGRIKLLLVSGVFIQNEQSRVDILIVGEALRKSLIKRILRGLEAEIGKELRYSIMDGEEFTYRRGLYDKFIRDVIDYPHECLIDKMNFR